MFYLKENDLIENDKQSPNIDWLDKIVKLGKNLFFGLSQPIIEVVYGIGKDTILYWPAIIWGFLFDLLVLTHLDQKFFKLAKIEWAYPTNPIAYSIYAFIGVTFGFWIWGVFQARKKFKMLHRLSETFLESGLKSPMGKLPNFIFDVPVDEFVRRLRITNAFMPKAKFVEAKDRLESGLQVKIDEILESNANGTIDLLYSEYEMTKLVELKDYLIQSPNKVLVGKTRAKALYADLTETPHFLVGGQTGGGKSTFLRQMITTLYYHNPNYEFSLVDMKGGLEFQIFENRKRISVVDSIQSAKQKFERLDEVLKDRFKTLKENNCKDIDEFYKKPLAERKLANGTRPESLNMPRQILVIDEAAELFLGSGKGSISSVQEITRIAIRLAAQGRAVGIHLIVATQKPDANAISTQIKANLVGIISFPMATFGASMSILGNGRAKELPAIPGRAVWRNGLDQYEVQTPFLSPDQAKSVLDKVSTVIEKTSNEEFE